MVFTEWEFLLFFPVVFAIHWSLRGATPRKAFLLAASYFFYGSWDWRFLGLIIGSSVLDWIIGGRIARTEDVRRRRLLLAVSLAFNLGALALFKYFNFFADSFAELMSSVGVEVGRTTLDIVLPVGISFYTFQTLSYTIDIHRRKLEPATSALDFFLFVAFFPQLVAGPIVRASEFLPQLRERVTLRRAEVFEGIERFMIGAFKKLMIADTIGVAVDAVYADPDRFSSLELCCGAVGFCYQIYADFSGYSDMAIGTALLLGYRLPVNFRLPYLSLSITDFWRRWHISLSFWFRDYLYVPLGGNRHGLIATYRNLVTTFLLTGLWHGASWNFVMFGAWNGAVLILERVWRATCARTGLRAPAGLRPLLVPACFALATASTIVSFIWFRARTLGQAVDVIGRILAGDAVSRGFFDWRRFLGVTVLVVVYHVLAAQRARERFTRYSAVLPFLRAFLYTVWLLLMLTLAPVGERAFIYFQF